MSRIISLPRPVQAGGWMAEENAADITNLDPVFAVTRKPVPAVSINGKLLGCLQGLLVVRSNDSADFQSVPISTAMSYAEESTTAYSADISMFPEGLRRGASEGVIPRQMSQQKIKSSLESSVAWSKSFSYPILCSLQQRQVSYMKITVYSADTVKTATTAAAKSSKKNILGTALLDMSSFIGTDSSAQIFLLPIKSQGRKKANELCGWLVLALQYFQSGSSLSLLPYSVSTSEIDDKAASTWASILNDPTIVSAGLSNSNINSQNTISAAQKSFTMGASTIQPLVASNSESIALHIAMGSLELAGVVASDLKVSKDEVLLMLVRAGSNNESLRPVPLDRPSSTALTADTWADEVPPADDTSGSAIAIVSRTTGLPEWDAADITVACAANRVFTPVVYFSLYRGKRVSSCQIDPVSSVFIGEAVIIISRASLMLGAPINVVTPLRDRDGARVAILQVGAQKTSLAPPQLSGQGNATMGMRSEPSLLQDRQAMNSSADDSNTFISLSICIDEGSVIDPFWRQPVEPFFEFSLVPPRDNITMPDPALCRARSGFVGRGAAAMSLSSGATKPRRSNQQSTSSRAVLADSPHSPWGLVCGLLLPKAGFPVGPADEMGKPIWAVAVVCRDAARAGCPEIASGRMGLPWSLLARGRSTDQWLVLFNSLANGAGAGAGQPGSSSLGMDMVMRNAEGQDNLATSGRIRLKMTSRSIVNNPAGQMATMSKPGLWTGVSAFQQFQSNFPVPTMNIPKLALGHTLVKGASHPGIGASLMWLKGLANLRSGQEVEPLDIVMASATSLVSPIISQSVYGDIYHDMDEHGSNKERLTFSELGFGRSGNTCDLNPDGSRTACASWGEDWMSGIPGLDGLCGSLPVAGGHSDLRMGVSVAHKKVPYTASFSILSGLTSCSAPGVEHDLTDLSTANNSATVSIPALDILVSANDDEDVGPGNGTGRKAFAKDLRVTVRSVPRLKLWTAYVPFVRGRLTVCCRSVRFLQAAQQTRRFPDGTAHRCALRFTMCTESFGYTASFEIPLTTDTAVTMPVIGSAASPAYDYNQMPQRTKAGRTGGGSSGDNSGFSVTIPVDTLDVTARGGSCSMLTLQVTLVDMDESGSLYCMGDGGMQTAPLYYQALRAASASAPPPLDSSAMGSVPGAIGVSPWLTSESVIYDRSRAEPVAWATLSSQFVMEGMSVQVAAALQAARLPIETSKAEEDKAAMQNCPESMNGVSFIYNGSEPELRMLPDRTATLYGPDSAVKTARMGSSPQRARTELGLKQAFSAADTDRSGTVSVEELLVVIKQSGVRSIRPRRGRGQAPTRGVVGMEDTVALLLGLAGDTVDTGAAKRPEMDLTTDAGLELTVRRIFSRLDVDGDGMISWWEWQASLSGALLGRHPSEKFIDPVEGLAVISQAAEDALTARAQLVSLRDPTPSGSGFPPLWDLPFIDPSDSSRGPISLPNGGGPSRLHQGGPSRGGWVGTSMPTDSLRGRDNLIVAEALKKLLDAEATAELARQAYRHESKKRADLEASLATLKRLNDVVRGARDDKDEAARLVKEKLLADAAGHKDNLARMKASQKKRLRASITIALFLKRRVVPHYRRKKAEREKAALGHALLGVFHRKHFLKTMDLRTRATLLLQKRVRGILGRNRLRKMKKAAIHLQRLYRGSRGRDRHHKMLLDRAACRFSAKYRAAEKLKHAMQRLVKKMKAKRNKAAVTIQSASRKRAAYKVLTDKKAREAARLKKLREEEEERQRRESAARLIGKMARDRAAINDAKGQKNRLLSEREQREKAAAEERERLARLEEERKMEEQRLQKEKERLAKEAERIAFHKDREGKARLEAEKEAARLAEEQRAARERERLQREKERQELENKAAIAIQAIGRGRAGRILFSDMKDERAAQLARLARYQAVAKGMRAVQPIPPVKDTLHHWVRFQKKHERGEGQVETEANTPQGSPRASSRGSPRAQETSLQTPVKALGAPSSSQKSPRAAPATRSVVGPSKPLISPRASFIAPAPITTGPLLIHFRDLSPIPIGTKVEALYGAESQWFPGKVVRTEPVPLEETAKPAPNASPRRKSVSADGMEEVLYHVRYDDGDEETCSRAKIRVPENKEKQPGVLAVGQEVHAECRAVGVTLRGTIMGGPYRTEAKGPTKEGVGAGTGGGAGPEDEYDVRFFLDDEKTKSTTEKVKRKDIIAPHLSASLVGELKEREAEKNEEKMRQAALAARQVVVKKAAASPSPRKPKALSSPRREGLVALGVSRGEGPDFSLVGEILKVDKHRRIIHAQLLHPTTLSYYTVELPYDHPRLLWFAYDPLDGPLRDGEEIVDLDQSVVPTLDEALEGYYVSYPVEGQRKERCGQVVSVNKDKRTIVAYFQDTVNGLVTDITETVPYDNPRMTWYKDESQEGEPALISWVPQPPLAQATGYLVEVRSLEPDAEKGDMFAGEVVAVDEGTKTILVSFDCTGEEEDEEDDVEIIPYDSLDIVWVSPPLCQSSIIPKPPLAQAVGCTVDVYNEEIFSKNGPKEVLRGKVMSVRESAETMRVRFKNGNPDEVFPYESMQVAWIAAPPPSFLSRSLVPRPTLPQAVGYGVEVQCREDAEEGEGHAYIGEVVSVNRESNTLKVLFEGSEEAGPEPDCEDIKYFSADIAWMKKTDPILSRSLVARPALADAVGYKIDVKSREPDHDHDDVFVGEVVSVDRKANTMRVLFKGMDGEAGDEEEVDYLSPDVAWMSRRSVPVPVGSRSLPFKQPIQPALQRSADPAGSPKSAVPRPSMHKAVGYMVLTKDLTGAPAAGVVSAVDVQKKAIVVDFDQRRAVASMDGNLTGSEHCFDFDSPAVAWMKEPAPCLLTESKVPRPPLAQCVGYEVDVKSTEPDAHPDDVFVGVVVSVSPAIRMIQVMFQGFEGSEMDEEDLPYDSKDIAWRKAPKARHDRTNSPAAAAYERKAVSPGKSPTTASSACSVATSRSNSQPASGASSPRRPPLSPYKQKQWDSKQSKEQTSLPSLKNAVGRYIAVSDKDGDIRGKVVGMQKKMLQIKLMDEDGTEDEEVLELQYSSPSIRWYKDWEDESANH